MEEVLAAPQEFLIDGEVTDDINRHTHGEQTGTDRNQIRLPWRGTVHIRRTPTRSSQNSALARACPGDAANPETVGDPLGAAEVADAPEIGAKDGGRLDWHARLIGAPTLGREWVKCLTTRGALLEHPLERGSV